MLVKDGIVKSFRIVAEAEKDADVILQDAKSLKKEEEAAA